MDTVDSIKQMILQQIRPINFGDELNIAAILGEEEPIDQTDYTFPVTPPAEEPAPPAVIPAEEVPPPENLLKPVENVICHVCSKAFTNSRNFKKHFNKHTGRFSCRRCNKVFARKETQQKHITRCKSIHDKTKKRKKTSQNEESKKYYCDKCSKSFTRRENYDQHVMIHDGVQVVCNFCQKKLSSFKSFQRHRKLHEVPQQKIACQECPTEFSLKSNLQRHMKFQKHKHKIICDKCNATVRTENILQKHHSQDTINTCTLCSQLYCLEHDLRSHLRKDHSNLWFKCKECTNRFFMTRSMKCLQDHAKKIHSVHLEINNCFEEGWFVVNSN